MIQDTSLLEEAIEFWGFSRQGTISEAENIPDEHWGFRPHPKAKNVSELVRHAVDAARMLLGEAADPDGDFTRRSPQAHVEAHGGAVSEDATPQELRDALRSSHEELAERVRAAGQDLMSRDITRFDGKTWKRITYVFYTATHEDYHRGQLATYARSMGIVPALTKRIHGDGAE